MSGCSTRSNTGPMRRAVNPCAAPTSAIKITESSKRRQVGPDVVEEAAEFVHADCWAGARVAIGACHVGRLRWSGFLRRSVNTTFSVRQGRQLSISDDPNNTTTGRPKAAAICAGPLSFPTNRAAPASSDFTSSSGAPWKQGNSAKADRSSPAPAMKSGSIPRSRSNASQRRGSFPAARFLRARMQTDAERRRDAAGN